MVLLLGDPLAVLLYTAADLALVLLGLVLVDLLADFLHNIVALLDGMRHPGALRLLEPVALGGILGPDLAAIAVLLPELLADLLLLIGALLFVLGLVVTLLPEIYKVMLVINTKKKDRGHVPTLANLLVQRHAHLMHSYLCSLWHSSSYSSTYLIFLTVLQWLTQSEQSSPYWGLATAAAMAKQRIRLRVFILKRMFGW